MSAFTFGDPRFPTCCGKPVGCTNITETCAYPQHRWKRMYVEDHPRPLFAETTPVSTADIMSASTPVRPCMTWPRLECACRGGLQPDAVNCSRRRERDRERKRGAPKGSVGGDLADLMFTNEGVKYVEESLPTEAEGAALDIRVTAWVDDLGDQDPRPPS